MIGELTARADLSASDREAMCQLMRRHYRGVTREVFAKDLDDKDYVIRISDAGGVLRGFTTMAVVPYEHRGRPIWVLYSGDTIVDPAARRSSALARSETANPTPSWCSRACSPSG